MNKIRYKILILIFFLSIAFTIFIYALDKIIIPTVIAVADAQMRAQAVEIINKCIIEECEKDFNYNDIIKIEKDNEGNIALLKADTLKLNKIACNVAVNSQNKLQEIGQIGIKMPMGYITRNNILASFGPPVTVKMVPIGYIESSYSSKFETAGINQTRHKIYIKVKTKIMVIIPLKNNEVEVSNQIPISETIIVGKIPNTAVQFDVNDAGFKLNN